LRLVALNACEGARLSPTDPFAGVAGTLVSLGLPAALAMQFEITDSAAILLAKEFVTTQARSTLQRIGGRNEFKAKDKFVISLNSL
jgi:hypothetical protein